MGEIIQIANFQSGYLEKSEEKIQTLLEQTFKNVYNPDFCKVFGKPVDVFETVIISDLHLGSKVCRAEELLLFLETVRFKRLIINGDVFDSINMKRLNRHHWKVLSILRLLTDHENGIDVIWLRGNHDGYADLISQLLGIQFYVEYELEWNSQKVLVFHGDIFDKFVSEYPLLTDFADGLYRMSVYLNPTTKRIGRWLKRNSKTFLRNTEKVREGAISFANHRHAGTVICGHTHHVEDAIVEGIRYLNPGSWTDSPTHFVGITEDQIRVVQYF